MISFRRISLRTSSLLISLLLLCAAASFAQSREDLREAITNAPRNLPWTDTIIRSKDAFNAGSEKIDPGLLALASGVRDKGLNDLDTIAKDLAVPIEGDMVAVTLIAEDDADVAKLRRDVTQLGGRVTTTYKNQVFALLPPGEINSLAKIDELYFASRQAMFYGDQEETTKGAALVDGVLKIKADRLHQAGIRGQGVKVGLLDFGFQHYQELQNAGLVPAPAGARAFTGSGQLDVNTEHGTACAEIIHAMAPDAQIYIAAVDGRPDQIILAAQWLKAQGVDIISFSGGGHTGPHNGSGLMDLLVQEITLDHHILWVNAAGNEADRHFRIDVPGGVSGWIPITQNTRVIAFAPRVPAISLLVNWDDWGNDPFHPSSTQDIDAVLFRYDKATGQVTPVAQSVNRQDGRMPPIEQIAGRVRVGDIFLLALHATNVSRPVRVHVYSNFPAQMMPIDQTGSIAIPATSTSALAVGAVDVTNDKLEVYSSRGPTDDNRAKPELSSYDNVRSAAYGTNAEPGRFPGTSAACPHVSGLAALLKSQQHDGDADSLRAKLMATLRQPSANDPGFGAGVTEVDNNSERRQSGAPPGPTTSIDLPDFLGGKISSSALEDLSRSHAEQPFEVKVRLGRVGNPPEYQVGDDMRLGYRTAEDAYCTLINRNAEGGYTVLPLQTDRLEAGQKYVYPDKIRVSEPIGSEEFIFVCSKDKVDLRHWRQLVEEGRLSVDVAHYEVKP